MTRCVCGCGKLATQRHHVIYRQTCRRAARSQGMDGWQKRYQQYVSDPDNLVDMHHDCHGSHHLRVRVLDLALLPDSVFAFAARVLGPGPAYENLSRMYRGTDPRLTVLYEEDQRVRSTAA